MSKEYRGGVIERVEHPVTKRTGVIRLDKRHMTFFAREVDNDPKSPPYADSSGFKVKQWLLEQLKHTTAADRLDWIPVIQIEHGGDTHHYYRDTSKEEQSESIKIEIKRYFIALTRDGREWRSLQWEEVDETSSTCLPENDRFAGSRNYGHGPKSDKIRDQADAFRLPSFEQRGYGGMDRKVVVAYTPELWQGLMLIIQTIRAARAQIAKLVNTNDGIKMVAAIGSGKETLLLQSGKLKAKSA